MNNTREIITLQFGSFANHVGTHFWNIQEHSFNYNPDAAELSEVNHDVLFREGSVNKNITYTPRMLLVDLKGTLKYLPQEGNLYSQTTIELNNPENKVLDQVRDSLAWDDENIEVIEEEVAPIPDYQKDLQATGSIPEKSYDFKDTVNHWPDFMYTRYHPRSINIVRNYEQSEDVSTLDTFMAGSKLWSTPYFEDDFTDKIRNYIEECDNCQGFQTIFDVVDGFSGLSLKCLEYLEDEYSKNILALPVIPPKNKDFRYADEATSDSIRVINTAYSYAKLSEFSSLFVPLSTMSRGWRNVDEPRELPHVNYDPTNFYHSSAVLATFIDTMSLRYRLREQTNFLSGFCSDMNAYNRTMAGAKLGMPFPMNDSEDLIDFLDRYEGDLMQPLSPSTKVGTDRIVQSICVRGIPNSRLKKPLESSNKQIKMPAYKCSSVSEMLQLYYQCNTYSSLTHVTATESKMRVMSPFPAEFFDNRFKSNGFLREFQSANVDAVKELPVMTAVQTSSDLVHTLESLHTNVSRIKIAKIPRFADAGLEEDDYKEMLEQLLVFKEQYEESFFA